MQAAGRACKNAKFSRRGALAEILSFGQRESGFAEHDDAQGQTALLLQWRAVTQAA